MSAVPWKAYGNTFCFCRQPNGCPQELLTDWFAQGWPDAIDAVRAWLPSSETGDPFAAAAALSLDKGEDLEKTTAVFRSLSDHAAAVFDRKRSALEGWAGSLAGHGPTGDSDTDMSLWRAAWGSGCVCAATVSPGLPQRAMDLHAADACHLVYALGGRPTGIALCDEFLGRISAGVGPEAATFAAAVFGDTLAVEAGLYDRYAAVFGAVLEIMHWPAMATRAGSRIEASLAGAVGALCGRRTSSTTFQAVSSRQQTPQNSSG